LYLVTRLFHLALGVECADLRSDLDRFQPDRFFSTANAAA
jgi:hypothetical protein